MITTEAMLDAAVQRADSIGEADVEPTVTAQEESEYVGVTMTALPVLALNTRGVSLLAA